MTDYAAKAERHARLARSVRFVDTDTGEVYPDPPVLAAPAPARYSVPLGMLLAFAVLGAVAGTFVQAMQTGMTLEVGAGLIVWLVSAFLLTVCTALAVGGLTLMWMHGTRNEWWSALGLMTLAHAVVVLL